MADLQRQFTPLLPPDMKLLLVDMGDGTYAPRIATTVTLAALPAGNNNIGDVDIASMPAASPLTDWTVSSIDSSKINIGLTGLTVKFAKANIAASTTDGAVVAAVTSKIIRVIAFRLHAGGTQTNCTFTSKPGGAGVAISELFALGANGGRADGATPWGHFQTASGEGLSLTTGAGSTVGVGVVYIEV